MIPIRVCAKAIIIRGGRILAVKYAGESGEYYALPGGAQHHGETLLEALERECREELGVKVSNQCLRFIREYIGALGESSWRDAEIHQVEFMYECEIEGPDKPIGGTHQDHLQVDVEWLPIDRISDYRFYPKKLVEYLGEPFPDGIEYWGTAE
jgi:ADP-ribose pyrophosphatase YjhB (NUDIX family)